MSSKNQYKALLKTTKQNLFQVKTEYRNLERRAKGTARQVELLTAELERVRLRRWWQFWKFFKRSQIIE